MIEIKFVGTDNGVETDAKVQQAVAKFSKKTDYAIALDRILKIYVCFITIFVLIFSILIELVGGKFGNIY